MRWLPIALLLAVLLAGCADKDGRSDENRFGGFYGGVNGGVVW